MTRNASRTIQSAVMLLICAATPFFAHANNLEAIQSRLEQPNHLGGTFEQTKHLKILSVPLISSGEFWIKKTSGVFWSTKEPVQSLLIITPNGVKSNDAYTQQANATIEHIGKLLQNILSADLQQLKSQFDITEIDTSHLEQWQLELTPKSIMLRKAITSIRLTGNQFIETVVLQEASGDQTDIHFTNVQAFEQLPTEISNAFITN